MNARRVFDRFTENKTAFIAAARGPRQSGTAEPTCNRLAPNRRSHGVGWLGQAFWRKRENFDAGVGDADRMLELCR